MLPLAWGQGEFTDTFLHLDWFLRQEAVLIFGGFTQCSLTLTSKSMLYVPASNVFQDLQEDISEKSECTRCARRVCF